MTKTNKTARWSERLLVRRTILVFGLSLVIIMGALAVAGVAQAKGKLSGCSYNGIKLYGKVQEVKAFPDLKVQVVSAFPDIKVQKVSAFADSCGKWQFVDAFPDFKVQFVDAFPDVKIQYVTAFPGM